MIDGLFRTEAGNGMAEVAPHRGTELGLRRNGEGDADGYGGSAELGAESLRETDLRCLRRAVSAHQRDAALPDDRGHDDQMAAVLRPETGQRRARTVERSHEIDVHHALHDLDRRVLN